MAYPTAIVEIAFTSGPYVQSPTWTDVTAYVRETTTRRGRPDEFQDFGPGTATIILDNRDRRFDPLNTAGPYYGNLVPRKQIRIRAEILVAGVMQSHEIFRGYVRGWPVSLTDAGFDSTVTLEAFDALGLLEYEEIPEDLADDYIRSLSPRQYWPHTDPIDPTDFASTTITDYGSNPHPLRPLTTISTANAEGLAPGLPNTSVLVADTNATNAWSAIANGTDPFGQGTFFSFCMWYRQPNTTGTTVLAVIGPRPAIEISYNQGTSTMIVKVSDTVNQRDYSATVYLDVTIPHHVALRTSTSFTSTVLNALIVDGVVLSASTPGPVAVTVPNGVKYYSFGGVRQQVAMFGGTTNAQLQTIYRLGRNVLTETSAARFTRLLAYSSFPSGLTSAPASPVANVGAFTIGGPTIASELQTVSDSEGGNLYVTKAGVITMTGRNQFAAGSSLTSQATIGTTGITIGTALEYSIDAENMRNQLAVGYSGDGSIEVSDATSVAAYGVAGGSITTQLTSQDDAETLGQFLVGFSKDPAVVISPVDVNVSAVAADWHTVLGLELLDRITFTVQPRTGASFTQQQLIQSIEHRVIPGQWSTTLNGSVRFTNPFIIGSSLLGGTDLIL